jgi:hypothetical protein
VLSRQLHEREMAFVQITHRRNKRDAQLTTQLITQLFNGVYNLQYILRIRWVE